MQKKKNGRLNVCKAAVNYTKNATDPSYFFGSDLES